MDFRGSAGKTRSAGRAFPAEKGGRHDSLPPETVPPPGTGCRRCCPGCCCRRWVILQHGDGGQGPPVQTHHAHQAVVGGVHAVRREQHRRAAAQGAHQAADCTTAPSAARTGPAYWHPGTGGRSPAGGQAVQGVGQKKFRKILVIPLICGPTACKITVKDLRL